MGKKRISIYLDEAVLERFKARAAKTGRPYQTLINEVLGGAQLVLECPTLDEIRRVVREELGRVARGG